MSKRRLGDDIDELSDDLLRDLEPEQRFQLHLRAQADGKEQWIDRLVETCPRYKYTATDHAFTDRVQLAQRLAQQAVYDLHTTYLHYEYLQQQQRYTWALDYERDEEVSDEELDRAAERADEIRESFAELYTSYHAHRRFATEILDVDPKIWLASHPEGSTVFEIVADVIDDQREIELAESYLNEQLEEDKEDEGDTETADPDQTAPDDDHRGTLEDVAEMRYEELTSAWEDAIAEIP
ncbi:hypothetical protein [Halalkalicoccus salilacus]|uniref:hypothetical protein n=1 Tax=Halalkalicoccus salilacus TaxID=3117459 RepID=UPI00300F6B4C